MGSVAYGTLVVIKGSKSLGSSKHFLLEWLTIFDHYISRKKKGNAVFGRAPTVLRKEKKPLIFKILCIGLPATYRIDYIRK